MTCGAATGQSSLLVHGGSFDPVEKVGRTYCAERCLQAVKEGSLDLLVICVPDNQHSQAVAFTYRMYREESIKKA